MSGRLYRKRSIVVEAIQWTGDNQLALQQWGATCYEIDPEDRGDDPEATLELFVDANSRWLALVPGEWIIRDIKGFYPCKADVFAATYEPADTPAETDSEGVGTP